MTGSIARAGAHGSLRYRADIDGLRAVAVLPIALFHAGYDFIPGGFIGVDIFFVISGFLIGSIIIGEIQAGRFSFATFYRRRVRRIVPALLLVLLATLLGGYFLLLPEEYLRLAASTLAALVFVPNVYFWDTASTYFGLDVATEPLLHTWSLGIEEQFYICLPPLLLLLFARLSKQWITVAVLALALGSFYCNLAMLPADEKFSFYMLPARAWELLCGVILALCADHMPRRRAVAETLATVGLLLCIAPMFLLSEGMPFPGVNAAYPVLGTALLIFAGGNATTTVNRLLASRLPVAIGKVSYSLYLWHWPIAVYALLAWPDSALVPPLVIVSSLLAATLSYFFVEQRYRSHPGSHRPAASLRELAGFTALTGGAVVLVVIAAGLPGRVPAGAWDIAGAPATGEQDGNCRALVESDDHANVICTLGAPGAPATVALWGDSHANALAPALDAAARARGIGAVLLEGSGCRPLLGVYRRGRIDCRNFNDAAIDYLTRHPEIDLVYLAGYWRVPLMGQGYDNSNFLIQDRHSRERSVTENDAVFRRGLARSVARLAGRRVVLIEDVPEIGAQFGKSMANHFVRQRWLRNAPAYELAFVRHEDTYASAFAAIVRDSAAGLEFLPLQEHLCDDERCPLMRKGRLLYGDGDHLSLHGSLSLARVIQSHLESAAPR